MNQALQRIPFGTKEELMVQSAARWMRFMAVVQIVGSLLGILGVLIFGVVWKALVESELAKRFSAETQLFIPEGLGTIVLVMCVFLGVTMLVALWAGSLLYGAADRFDRVAKTDEADQDYLAEAFAKLKTFFVVEAAFALLTVVNAIVSLAGGGQS